MKPASQSALSFIQELADVAQELAALDLTVSRLHCDWNSFGSWSMLVERERKARKAAAPNSLYFGWDGRDGILSIQSAPSKPRHSSGQWQTVLEQEFQNSSAALEFAANFSREFASKKWLNKEVIGAEVKS